MGDGRRWLCGVAGAAAALGTGSPGQGRALTHPLSRAGLLMLIDDLRRIFLFEGLSDEQLRDLIAAGDEVRFESGDVLFREGEPADFWWVLVEGRVELLRRTRW